jgi:hypothetical protein
LLRNGFLELLNRDLLVTPVHGVLATQEPAG